MTGVSQEEESNIETKRGIENPRKPFRMIFSEKITGNFLEKVAATLELYVYDDVISASFSPWKF